MDEELTIRRVEAGDFEAVAKLLTELGRPAPGGANLEAAREVFERHARSGQTASLVALRGATPVGVLVLEFRDRLNWTTPEAWIPDLLVTESEHGRGVGPALLRRAIELARQRGCHRLTLESGYQRQRAHRFYAREGMTDAGKYFILDLA
jgi:GNAT superfamily N-acetyltransferase